MSRCKQSEGQYQSKDQGQVNDRIHAMLKVAFTFATVPRGRSDVFVLQVCCHCDKVFTPINKQSVERLLWFLYALHQKVSKISL